MSGQLHVLYVHFGDRTGPAGEESGTDPAGGSPELLGLLADFTPVVQALPPDAALADVRGAAALLRP